MFYDSLSEKIINILKQDKLKWCYLAGKHKSYLKF